METNVKAVINLMQTLGVGLDDVTQALSNDSTPQNLSVFAVRQAIETGTLKLVDLFPKGSEAQKKLVAFLAGDDFAAPVQQPKIEFRRASNGRSYAVLGNKVLGVLICSQTLGRFVFALEKYGENISYDQALRELSNMPAVAGKKWIVPSDDHLRAAVGSRDALSSVNFVLNELHGAPVGSRPLLSSTSQANRPNRWDVRLVLPLD